MAEKTYKIYLLICNPEEKGYAGQTCQSIELRCRKNGKGYPEGTRIREAFDRHTEDDFVCIILEDGLTKEKANEREVYWISFFNLTDPRFGYNIMKGGIGGDNGKNGRPPKKVFQYSLDGQFIAEYPSASEAERRTGISQSNITNCCLGKIKSIGKSLWSYQNKSTLTYENHNNTPVLQLSKEGILIKEYSSLKEAEEQTGVSYQNISACCRGKTNSAGGSIWKYA